MSRRHRRSSNPSARRDPTPRDGLRLLQARPVSAFLRGARIDRRPRRCARLPLSGRGRRTGANDLIHPQKKKLCRARLRGGLHGGRRRDLWRRPEDLTALPRTQTQGSARMQARRAIQPVGIGPCVFFFPTRDARFGRKWQPDHGCALTARLPAV